jgi:iron(III) transport system substrate-binding protein
MIKRLTSRAYNDDHGSCFEVRERAQHWEETMKFLTSAAVSAVSAVALLGAATIANAAELNSQEKALIAGAKAEGQVTIIHPLFSDRTATRMGKAFKARYGLGDKFKFNSLRKGTGATVSQVRQEIKAGKHTADLILVSAPGFFAAANDIGAFLELDSGYWKDSADVAKAAGQYANYPFVVTPLAYTFAPVWNSSCPGMENVDITSYADVLDLALKGKTISSDITKSFTYTNTVISLGENGAVDFEKFWPALKALDPIVEFRTEPKMQMVISCQRPIDPWNISGRVYQNVLKSPDLADKLKIGSYKEGQVMLGNQVAVLKGSKHPNAAKLLVEFLLSEEGADIYVEGEAVYSFRAGYKPPAAAAPYLMDLSQHKLLGMTDWVGAQSKFKEVRALWVSHFK